MDAIKGYCSDEDDLVEEGTTMNDHSRPAFDFFNLTVDSNSMSMPQTQSESKNTQTTMKIQSRKTIDGVEVEIPKSSFWSSVKLDDVTVLNNPSNINVQLSSGSIGHNTSDYKVNANVNNSLSLAASLEWKRYEPVRNTMTNPLLNNVFKVKEQHLIKDKDSLNPNSTVSSHKHGKRISLSNNDNSGSKKIKQIDEQLQISSTDNSSVQSNRKLFYIHSKIRNHFSGPKIKKRAPVRLEKEITAHASAVNRVKWNISEYSHLFLSVSMDKSLKIWNWWTDLEYCIQTLNCHTRAVKDADWSICGKQVLSCSYDKTAALTDVETGERIATFGHQSFVNCGKFHPETAHLMLTGCHNSMFLWDERSPQKPQREYVYKDKLGQVVDLIFSLDGNEIFCCCDEISRDSADRNIMAWDFSSGVVLSNQIYQERYSCTRLKRHPTEGHFLAQSQGGYIAIFSVNKPYKMTKIKRFEGHKVSGYGIGFDIMEDGSSVVSASEDGKLYCYNYYNGQCFRKLNTGLDVCLDVAVHPVLPSTVVCCGLNGKIQLWT